MRNPNGPGKYDELCAMVQELAQARGAFVIVIDGSRGTGFSGALTAELVEEVDIPRMLRSMADQIEAMR